MSYSQYAEVAVLPVFDGLRAIMHNPGISDKQAKDDGIAEAERVQALFTKENGYDSTTIIMGIGTAESVKLALLEGNFQLAASLINP